MLYSPSVVFLAAVSRTMMIGMIGQFMAVDFLLSIHL